MNRWRPRRQSSAVEQLRIGQVRGSYRGDEMSKVHIHVCGPITKAGVSALSVKLAEWAEIMKKAEEHEMSIEHLVEGQAESFTLKVQPLSGHHPNQGAAS